MNKIIFIAIAFVLTACGSVPSVDNSANRKPSDRGVAGKIITDNDNELKALMRVVKLVDNTEAEADHGDTLTKKDSYAVTFSAANESYVYIFQIDSGGNKARLFPNTRFSGKNNPVKANESYRIPNTGTWLRLDDNIGEEKIILLASQKPLPDTDISDILTKHKNLCEKERRVGGKRKEFYYTAGDQNKVLVQSLCFIHK